MRARLAESETSCVAPISRYADEDTVILDGSGNDAYFWKPPRPLDLAKLHLGLNRIPGLPRLRRGQEPALRAGQTPVRSTGS